MMVSLNSGAFFISAPPPCLPRTAQGEAGGGGNGRSADCAGLPASRAGEYRDTAVLLTSPLQWKGAVVVDVLAT